MISLYFIKAYDGDGANLDLLVRAHSKAEALAAWVDYFEVQEEDMGVYDVEVGLIPDAPRQGVIKWEWMFPEPSSPRPH